MFKVYGKAYDLMIISVVIAEEYSMMDYEDIWNISKEIYEEWCTYNGSEYKYLADFARYKCKDEKYKHFS